MEGGTGRSSWRVVRLGDEAAWQDALSGIPHGIAHTWAYNAAIQRSTQHPIALFLAEADAARFACVVAERGTRPDADVYTPLGFGGPVGDGDDSMFLDAWADFVRQRRHVAGYLGLHPVLAPASLAGRPDAAQVHEVYLLDVHHGPEAMLARMSSSTRRRLRRRASGPDAITTDRRIAAEAFIRMYHPFMHGRAASPAYQLADETLDHLCRMPGVTLYATPPGEPRAVVMIGESSGGAEYIFGVAEDDARQHILPLLWRAAEDLATLGARWFNLGGGIRPGDSLAEFKRRLGGRPVPLISLRQVYRPERYKELCLDAGTATSDPYFPSYRAPRGGRRGVTA